MRVAELSRESGVAVPTIKYYVREGLLPPGELTSPNQAQYGAEHTRRLRLIRALLEVGGLTIAEIRHVLEAIDNPEKSLHETLGKAQYATTPRRPAHPDAEVSLAAAEEVDELLGRLGWHVRDTSPARPLLASAIAACRDLGQDDLLDDLGEWATAALTLARKEVKVVWARPDRESAVQSVVVGAVLGDTILAALRRMAQEHVSAIASGSQP